MTKVLVCSEFSQLGSGYGVYTKELMKGFAARGIEAAELASFCRPEDPRIGNCQWRVYPVMPPSENKQANEQYSSHPLNVFGKHIFEHVLLDYRPTHVIDIRDVWNFVHEFTSPYRNFYSHLIMPAVDSHVQLKTWLELYSRADGVVNYCQWAKDVLSEYGVKNLYGLTSPVPPMEFEPLPTKDKLKDSLGLGQCTILGTVMRNQPRKLYPQLFKMFRRLLDETGRNDLFLYTHTSYPDVWELDELIIEHNIPHKVLFTYQCGKCGFAETAFYKTWISFCPKCKEKALRLPSPSNPMQTVLLNQIYNIMDLYIQYSALEGYGIPIAEAISAGVPTMCVNYSAMETFINEGNSIPIELSGFHIEPETGRRFAVPNEDDAISKVKEFLSLSPEDRDKRSKLARLMYGTRDFNQSVDTWVNAIKATGPKEQWNSPQKQYNIPTNYPKHLNNVLFARWLIISVLQDISYIGSHLEARLVRDLDSGMAMLGHDGQYYYEVMGVGGGNRFQQFNQDIAFNHFKSLLLNKVRWEDVRSNSNRQ